MEKIKHTKHYSVIIMIKKKYSKSDFRIKRNPKETFIALHINKEFHYPGKRSDKIDDIGNRWCLISDLIFLINFMNMRCRTKHHHFKCSSITGYDTFVESTIEFL